jgi:The GLUG motif
MYERNNKMKKFTWLVFAVLSVAFVSMLPSAASAFDGGDGTPGTPYQISNCVQLQEMNNNLNASYVLMNDIDCSDTINWNGGAGFLSIGGYFYWTGGFTGTFDGQNHTITGLFINGPQFAVGLFGSTSGIVTIKNVALVDVKIAGGNYVGGLVGYNFGTIINSYVTGSVTSGGTGTGGLVGVNYGPITKSYATGSVTGNYGTGGLVGLHQGGTITKSYATGSVSGSYAFVGGLVGDNMGTIENSYATGSASGSAVSIGGLAGANGWYAKIINSYATGSVSGNAVRVGGLVGYNQGAITNSYWDIETSGQPTSAGGVGKTTAEMKQQATFIGWDFVNIWAIKEAVSYPYFFWQIIPTLGPANMWIGLKNSDDVGTRFDLLAEVFKNGSVIVGSGELDDVSVGSSGFNRAVTRTIAMAFSGSPTILPSDTLSFRLSVRISTTSGHRGGTARLWYNDAQTNSSFDATIGSVNKTYYLLTGFGLGVSAGPGPKKYIDVSVDRLVGGNPFKPFGTWKMTF